MSNKEMNCVEGFLARAHRLARYVHLAVLYGALLAAAPLPAQTPVTAGYRDFNFGTTVISTPTGEKPESKLWWNDGFWWADMWNPAVNSYRIYRLDMATQTWTDTGTALDNRPSSKADVLWDDVAQKLYVASHIYSNSGTVTTSNSQWARLYRFSYDPATKKYTKDTGFPVFINQANSETLTIAKDSTGRLWITWVQGTRVMVNHSTTSDTSWATPFVLPASTTSVSVKLGNISSVIAFQGNKIGVMWNNEVTNITYFAVHRDADAPSLWQPEEHVEPGPGCQTCTSNDHVNLKTDSAGRVYAALKGGVDNQPSLPRVILAVRAAAGGWFTYTFGLGQDKHTRPIVEIDEENDVLYMFATAPDFGGTIYMKSAPLNNISFPTGLGKPFILSSSDLRTNNATSTKQNLTSAMGLVVLASDQSTTVYLHNTLALSNSGGPTISSFSPTSGTVGTAVTLLGNNFTGTTAVKFNGTSATFSVVSATRIDAQVPSGATTGKISVTNASGTGISSTDFTVTQSGSPTINSFSPTSGTVGTAVTITGSNFQGTTAVKFNGTAAAFTVVSSTQISTQVPSGASTGPISVTNAAGTAVSSTNFTVSPTGSLRIKNITFENGSLTDPTTGADKVVGSVTLVTSGPIDGAYSAGIPNTTSSYLEENFSATDDFYMSFYLRLNSLPSGDVRLAMISNAGVTVGNLFINPAGELRLRAGSTNIGALSAALVPGTLYRVGIHQKKGSGGNAVLEAFLAIGTSTFGASFASTNAGTWTNGADRLRVGATAGSGLLDIVLDDVRLDGGSMPPP